MSSGINAWNKIFRNFKELYPRQARRVERFRPLDYPRIEVIFKDGMTMIYDDYVGKAHISSAETVYDRIADMNPEELYLQISDDDYARTFSINIDELMTRCDLNARELSEITGINYRTVRRYVTGESLPDIFEALKLATALKSDIRDLILVQ